MSLLTLAEAIRDIGRLTSDDDLAIDTETTGLDLYAGDVIRGVSVAYRSPDDRSIILSGYFPISHPNTSNLTGGERNRLVRALSTTKARHVFWNRNFDQASLAQIGMKPRTRHTHDAGMVSWLINENDSHKLKVQGDYYLGYDASAEQEHLKQVMAGVPAKDILANIRPFIRKGKVGVARQWAQEQANKTRKTWGTLTGDDIAEYAARDTVITLELSEKQERGEIGPAAFEQDGNYTEAIPHEHAVQDVVYRMCKRGVKVNLEAVESLATEYRARLAEIEPEFEGTNLRSTMQLSKLLFETWGLPPQHRTASGWSTDKDTLMELAHHDGVELILEHRALSKMVGTYLEPMARFADDNCRVHSSINTSGTVTGRFSSSRPNLQNIPKASTDGSVKKLYVPGEGLELWEYDLHSAELYVGAALAGDDAMIEALTEPGRNFHKETAAALFPSSDEPFYTLAKNLNYGIPYGIGPYKFALYLVKGLRQPMSDDLLQQARSIIQGHKRLWPKTHAAMARCARYAEQNDCLPMLAPGRWRHFGGWRTSVPSYTAWNAAVQGGVAEIMKAWMVRSEPELTRLLSFLVLQVHDSLWIEQPPGIAEQLTALLQATLDEINPLDLRITIDAKRLN